MNQKNGKNSLGLDIIFEDLDNPIELFKKWFSKAEESEINDPNAVAIATSNKNNQPNVRMVLLKGLSDKGFVFYTNFNSKKGNELKENQKASMCFHWKSLRRQVRAIGKVEEVSAKEADEYFNSRSYGSKIGAWASNQSSVLKSRDVLLKSIEEFNSKSYQQVRGTGHEGYSMLARAHLRHVHKQVARAAATPLPDSPPQQSVFGNVPASVPRLNGYIYTLYK